MNRSLLVGLVLLTLPVALYSQKSRVFSVIQLIESGKYTEAKEAIELAVWNDKTSRWSRTYYAKGLLCQKAYEQGIEKNDEKLTSLYPDQLIVAHSSYEKALELGPGNRIRSAISVHYYSLANLFKSQGSAYYRNKQYSKALKAFEHALLVNNSSVIESSMDTSLVFNTALAAFESRNWEKAISYLTGLNDDGYSPESAILLYRAHMHQGDSILAEAVLENAIGHYESDEDLVMQLVDHLVNANRLEEAIQVLSEAGTRHPDHPLFPWTMGLLFDKVDRNEEAIQSLLKALELSPEEPGILYGLGICHFNLGVSYEEKAREISNRSAYQQVRAEARKQFLIAIDYLEKTKAINPEYRGVSSRLNLLHQHLQVEQ
jgi:tetratricopeptide (TPR) repeat protein